ncbi:uncharacterized protein LOC142985388, partial [Anticarsia gemmatalis]|uniref:uncharacterized protein LOC142985388 n=1 Tax=Anticarsia gemmatalis TaxID=129554 RepID=UPI003F777FD1
MDDDIDIEEHDVLDNPRIRNIFPDLSRVKLEVPDEIEENYEEPQEYQPDYDYQIQVKTEPGVEEENNYEQFDPNNVPFDPNNGQFDPNTGQLDPNNGQFDPQDGQFSPPDGQYEPNEFETNTYQIENYEQTNFPNKIIIGSKPSYETLYNEALNIKVSVFLEDWGERLTNSPCYCHSCEILFPTVNALDAHNMISHSLLVALDMPRNTARKSTVSSTYCNHCSKTFPNDTALIKHLYELLPLNNFKPPEPVEKANQFKCLKCKALFSNYNAAKKHRRIVHPGVNSIHIIQSLKPK